MINNIAVTGYYWSGSSAVLDLLSEYQNVAQVPSNREDRDYEHVAFYYGGGLFDLCNSLTHGNTIVGSDYALNIFRDSMKRLYDNKFIWFGSYKHLVGPGFLSICDDFINRIAVNFEGNNYNHLLKMRFSLSKTVRKSLSMFSHLKIGNPIVSDYVRDDKNVFISLPTINELISATRVFTKDYMELFSTEEGVEFRLFDHLVWPQQINEFLKFIDPDLKIVVVQRDVRDIFISNKYLCHNHFFPTDVYDFIELYRRVVGEIEKHPNVIIVNFEDLIYKYDEMERYLEEELGLFHKDHTSKYKFFNPENSIENTQVFRCKEEWSEEVAILEARLPHLIYNYPVIRKPDINKIMDKSA